MGRAATPSTLYLTARDVEILLMVYRYDGLVKELGGPDIPGIGFAAGVERMALLLAQQGKEEATKPVVFFAPLGPAEEESLARLDQNPAPFPEVAAFLRQLAAGQLPPIPHSLPAELGQWLEDFAQAIRDAPRG